MKNSFLNELVENADLHKPVLNKIKTINELCVKYDFVAPLRILNNEFTDIREIMVRVEVLNIYKLNIYQILDFMF